MVLSVCMCVCVYTHIAVCARMGTYMPHARRSCVHIVKLFDRPLTRPFSPPPTNTRRFWRRGPSGGSSSSCAYRFLSLQFSVSQACTCVCKNTRVIISVTATTANHTTIPPQKNSVGALLHFPPSSSSPYPSSSSLFGPDSGSSDNTSSSISAMEGAKGDGGYLGGFQRLVGQTLVGLGCAYCALVS